MKTQRIHKKLPTEIGTCLYRLNYITGNTQHFRILCLSNELNLEEIVKAAKAYCYSKNYRFIFIEPAITTIDPEGNVVDEFEIGETS